MKTLDTIGFKDLKFGTVSGAFNSSGRSPDVEIVDGEASGYCYPFDRDRMIRKTADNVHSVPSTNPQDIEQSRRLRKEIIRIVRERI